MDMYPHKIIRHIILGDRERVLSSKAIWKCLQCATCSVRCPNDIDVARVFDTLRKVAVAENREAEKATWIFYRHFLESVKKHGRLHEMEAIMGYMLEKKDFANAIKENTKTGIGMLVKGRMGIFPHNIKDRKGFRDIFRRIEEKELRTGEKRS